MSKAVYVLTLEGEPIHVYSLLIDVENDCRRWFIEHKTDYIIEQDFNWWIEDRDYYWDSYSIDEVLDGAWEDYIQEQFESGTWGDYAWYEAFMD